MANICITDITINAYTKEQKEGLKQINKLIEESKGKIGAVYTEILAHSDIEGKDEVVTGRGEVTYTEISENGEKLTIHCSDAWKPHLELFVALVNTYASGAALVFRAEEPGYDIYVSNDDTVVGTYYIDIYDNSSTTEKGKKLDDNSYYDLSESEAIAMLNDYFGATNTSINGFTRLIDEVGGLNIHQFENAEISDYSDIYLVA